MALCNQCLLKILNLLLNGQKNVACICRVVEYANRRLLKISFVRLINIHELLRIPVGQREPATLNLDHKSVTFFKRMCDIRKGKLYFFNFTGAECLWLFKAITVLATHDFASHKHLVASHRVTVTGTSIGLVYITRIFKIIREYIYYFYNKVSISTGNARF